MATGGGEFGKVAGSDETVSSGYDLFANPPTLSSSLSGQLTEFSPTTAVTANGPVEIVVPALSGQYLDMANSYLRVQMKVTAANGNALSDTAAQVPVQPGELMAHSIFKTVELFVNDRLLEFASDYPYKAFVEVLTSTDGYTRKKKHKMLDGWYEDANSGKDGDALNADATASRKADITSSKTLDYSTKLRLGFLNQERMLLPGCSLKFRFTRSPDGFCLMAADNTPTSVVRLTKCTFMARLVQANPAILSAHNRNLLEGHEAVYPIRRAVTATYTVPPGTRSESRTIQVGGQCPERLFVGLVAHDGVNGTYDHNPFAFKNFGVSKMELVRNGQTVGAPYEPVFASGLYAREYYEFLSALHRDTRDVSTISPDQYAEGGRTIYAFDLRSDKEDGQHLIKNASLTLKLSFAADTTETLSLILYSERADTIGFDFERNFTHTGDTLV